MALPCTLIRANIRLLDHICPLRRFSFHECTERLGIAVHRIGALCDEFVAQFGDVHRADDFAVQTCDDVSGRAGGGEQGHPAFELKARQARLSGGIGEVCLELGEAPATTLRDRGVRT